MSSIDHRPEKDQKIVINLNDMVISNLAILRKIQTFIAMSGRDHWAINNKNVINMNDMVKQNNFDIIE